MVAPIQAVGVRGILGDGVAVSHNVAVEALVNHLALRVRGRLSRGRRRVAEARELGIPLAHLRQAPEAAFLGRRPSVIRCPRDHQSSRQRGVVIQEAVHVKAKVLYVVDAVPSKDGLGKPRNQLLGDDRATRAFFRRPVPNLALLIFG